VKTISLLLISHNLPHHPKKKEKTSTDVLVPSVDNFVFSTQEELAQSFEYTVQQETLPPIHKEYEEDIVIFYEEQSRVDFELNNGLDDEVEGSSNS